MKGSTSLRWAQQSAQDLANWLRPGCERVEIAGSIRRGRESVGDIEILAVPKMVPAAAGLFEGYDEESGLDPVLEMLVAEGRISRDLPDGRPGRDGPMWKQFALEGIQVDLFIHPAEHWGLALAIRTGPAEFSKMLVTSASLYPGYGLLPSGMQVRGWRLLDQGETLETPEEPDVFKAIGRDYIEPRHRDDFVRMRCP